MKGIIWKEQFNLAEGESNHVEKELPLDAEIVAFQMQGNFPTIWFWSDPEVKEKQTRTFSIVATGEEFDRPALYHGTVQLHGGSLVFHLIEHT